MSTGTAPPPMAKKKAETTKMGVTKINEDVLDDARITVSYTKEGLGEFLSRLLAPIVAKERELAEAKYKQAKGKK